MIKKKLQNPGKKLFDAIEKCKSPIKSINRVTDLDTQLSKEIDWFTSGGGRGKYLQAMLLRKNYEIPGKSCLMPSKYATAL